MAIAYRSSGTLAAGAVAPVNPRTDSDLVISLPSGHAAGDLLLMDVSQGVTTTLPVPSGWTLAIGHSWTGTGTRYSALMWKWDGGSESNPTVVYTAGLTGGCWGVIHAFSGVGVKANPFNITPAVATGSGTSKVGAAMTSVTIANCMPVWFFQNGDNGIFGAATSPAVAMVTGASYDTNVGIDTSFGAVYKPVQAIGSSGTGTIACASGEIHSCIGVMLDPTVVATGPTRLFQPF